MKCSLFFLLAAFCCSNVTAQFQCQSDADCLNNGSCQQPTSTRSYCQCPFGFGDDDCSATCLKDCQNGGSCRFTQDVSHGSDQDGNTLCECEGDFLGTNCEIPYTLCPDNQHRCLHGGACVPTTTTSGGSAFGCDCVGIRTGDQCQYDSPDDPRIPDFQCQADADCLNKGSCIQDGSEKICQCKNGFGGDDCAVPCSRDCQNGGSCRYQQDISHGGSDQDGDTFCQCLGSFAGVNCEIPFTLCSSNVRCLHGGICEKKKSNNGGYGCQCPAPRTGDMCQYTSNDDPRISATQSSSKNPSDQENLNKALAMTLGTIVVAGMVTLGAMLAFRKTNKGSVETKHENDVTTSSAAKSEVC